MREIKFRGKRVDNGDWVYGNLIGNDVIVGEIVDWDEEYFTTEFWIKVEPETVGQYTELKDKNGVEIYEEDIVKGELRWMGKKSRHIGEVKYICQSFKSVGINKHRGLHAEINGLFEVIGNIHEEEKKWKN